MNANRIKRWWRRLGFVEKIQYKNTCRRLESELEQCSINIDLFINESLRNASKTNAKGELLLFETVSQKERIRDLILARDKAVVILNQVKSTRALRQASRMAIAVPTAKEVPTWWANDHKDGMPDEAVRESLSEEGAVGVTKLIREEKRKNIEWWVKIITPLLTALVSIIGLIVALVTVSKK